MRIMHIGGFYPQLGGSYSFIKDISLASLSKGMSISILTPEYPRLVPLPEDVKTFDIRFVRTNRLASVWPTYSTVWQEMLTELLPQTDIIHLHGLFTHFSLVSSRFTKKIPVVCTLHGVTMPNALNMKGRLKKKIYLQTIGKRTVERLSLIHLLNNVEKETFFKVYNNIHGLQNRTAVIPVGIHYEKISKIKPNGFIHKKFPHLRGKKIILFLGRIHPIKGIDILLDAFQEIVKYESNCHLLIVGPDNDGYYQNVLSRTINSNKLQSFVTYAGPVFGDDKFALIKECHLFVLPSYSDSFPVSLLEAMACGVPVVISKGVGIFREIENNKAGVVVDAARESLFRGLKSLCDNEALRKEVAGNGKGMAAKYFDISNVADSMISIYKNLIREREARHESIAN